MTWTGTESVFPCFIDPPLGQAWNSDMPAAPFLSNGLQTLTGFATLCTSYWPRYRG